MICEGKIWKFGDEINTDLMVPSTVMMLPQSELPKYCFSLNRPGWVDLVHSGDMIIAGRNFGIGSSRPGAKVLRDLGISCILAESINGLFLRNSINFGLPALSCPGVYDMFNEGDFAEVNFQDGIVRNRTKGIILNTTPLPQMLLKIIKSGGLIPMLEAAGCLE